MMMREDFVAPPRFAMLDLPVGGSHAPAARRPSVTLAGGPIAALADGSLVIDEDSGQLVRLDAKGEALARIDIAPGAPQLAVDRKKQLAYVVDRAGDQIRVISLERGALRAVREIDTAAEPYGVALTPDGSTLLVTAVADRTLTGYRAATGEELWSTGLGEEPRGVAVSPDGREVAVASLRSGAMARGLLAGARAPRLENVALHQTNANAAQNAFRGAARAATPGALHPDVAASGNLGDRPGESFARAAFTVAFVGHGIAIVPHQLSTPHQAEGSEDTGSYGGGFTPPVVHQVAFVTGAPGEARTSTAEVPLHMPRAAAYDPALDRLYVFGYGSDSVAAIGDVSQASIHLAYQRALGEAGVCGPTGAAVADDGDVLVFCSLSRKVVTIAGEALADVKVAVSGELTSSRLSADEEAGRRIFRTGGDARLSKGGGLACESCHPEARTDGLSWRIESKVLQTPLLAGRVAGTHPFKWDGGDKTITDSLTNTVRRLGGHGLGTTEVKQLAAYLESLPAPRTPSRRDPAAVARGKKIFANDVVGCNSCHGGERMTDGRQHPLAHDIDATDTPSLIGLAQSAPYFHDGSAATLEALLTDRGSVHGMGRTAKLGQRQIDDLVAYLESL
jgi:DNA-binding beta-propeller fold protein YncE